MPDATINVDTVETMLAQYRTSLAEHRQAKARHEAGVLHESTQIDAHMGAIQALEALLPIPTIEEVVGAMGGTVEAIE
jgi:hypothetical protein